MARTDRQGDKQRQRHRRINHDYPTGSLEAPWFDQGKEEERNMLCISGIKAPQGHYIFISFAEKLTAVETFSFTEFSYKGCADLKIYPEGINHWEVQRPPCGFSPPPPKMYYHQVLSVYYDNFDVTPGKGFSLRFSYHWVYPFSLLCFIIIHTHESHIFH